MNLKSYHDQDIVKSPLKIGLSEADRRKTAAERIPVQVYRHAAESNLAVAQHISELIRKRQNEGKNCVLGLATRSTPVGVYDELVRMHRDEGLSLVVFETALYNLTRDHSTMMVHFGPSADATEVWRLVRLEEPDSGATSQPKSATRDLP